MYEEERYSSGPEPDGDSPELPQIVPDTSGPPEEHPVASDDDTPAEAASCPQEHAEPPETAGEAAPRENAVPDAGALPPIDMGPLPPTPEEAEVRDDAYAVELHRAGRLKQIWRERRLFIVLSCLFVLLAIGAASAISYVYFVIHPYEDYDRIMPNVYCAGIDLSGMTTDEARSAIEEALRYPSYEVRLILPDCEYTFHPRQEGITLNGASVAQAAYDYGREDTSAYGLYRAYKAAEKTEYRLDAKTDLAFSAEDIQAQVEEIYEETEILPTVSAASCDSEAHTVTLTLGQPGRCIDEAAVYEAVSNAFEDMDFSDIAMEYEKIEIDMDETRRVCRRAAADYYIPPTDPVVYANEDGHTIELTMGVQGWEMSAKTLYTLAESAVAEEVYGEVSLDMAPVEPEDVDITEAYAVLACEPVEPYYYRGTIVESTCGYTLDWETAISDILAADYGQQLSIAMTPIEPELTAAEMEAVLFRDQLSSFSTPHTSNSNRTHNLTLACEAINGTVINAGETFSFNGVVGERTADKGYRSATVYVGTESKEELGGGICQVASTIYDAALYAEMEITSRTCHTFFVTYVEGGLDATVYWGSLDFCFKNSTRYPIRVNASVSGGYVRISIDGTKTNDHVVKLSSTRLSTTPYSTVYEYDSSKPTGYEKETTTPYTGYSYEAYQYIYDGNGNLLETNYLGKSTYSKRDRVITIGTG